MKKQMVVCFVAAAGDDSCDRLWDKGRPHNTSY